MVTIFGAGKEIDGMHLVVDEVADRFAVLDARAIRVHAGF